VMECADMLGPVDRQINVGSRAAILLFWFGSLRFYS